MTFLHTVLLAPFSSKALWLFLCWLDTVELLWTLVVPEPLEATVCELMLSILPAASRRPRDGVLLQAAGTLSQAP